MAKNIVIACLATACAELAILWLDERRTRITFEDLTERETKNLQDMIDLYEKRLNVKTN